VAKPSESDGARIAGNGRTILLPSISCHPRC